MRRRLQIETKKRKDLHLGVFRSTQRISLFTRGFGRRRSKVEFQGQSGPYMTASAASTPLRTATSQSWREAKKAADVRACQLYFSRGSALAEKPEAPTNVAKRVADDCFNLCCCQSACLMSFSPFPLHSNLINLSYTRAVSLWTCGRKPPP